MLICVSTIKEYCAEKKNKENRFEMVKKAFIPQIL